MTSNRPYRFLCLHGYRQDGRALRQKMGSLRQKFSKTVEFDYVDAPHLAKVGDEPQIASELSWYATSETGEFYAHSTSPKAYGFEESIEVLDKHCEEHGPYNALLGFSQGGTMAHLYFAHCVKSGKKPFKGIVVFAGFPSKVDEHRELMTCKNDAENLFILSTYDTVITSNYTEELARNGYSNPNLLYHEGRHGIPNNKVLQLPLQTFIDRTLLSESQKG
ncbi:hypothetical protein FO519_001160 [Halicephalobus sp. NKZ332]|nr:hypothetical protein FO519_001160 [Halicephalobus sp. NKZ332]